MDADLERAIEAVRTDGWCKLPGAYSAERAAEALERVREGYERWRSYPTAKVPYLNTDQPTLYNLQGKDPFFLDLLFEPAVVGDLLKVFLNDPWFRQIPPDEPNYVLRSYIARSSKKELPMHIDSFVPYLGDHVFIVQYAIVLEPQSATNGCTVLVPGSHRRGEYATQEARRDAIPIDSEPGDVVFWDSRLWHGTTENTSGGTRWAIIATFCRWWMKQHFAIPQLLPEATYARLTPSQRAVLGFASVPHWDESTGIDMKRGYDDLPPDVRSVREPPPHLRDGAPPGPADTR